MMKNILGIVMHVVFLSCNNSVFSQLTESPWPMYQHDLQHTGRSQYTGPENPAQKWVFRIGTTFSASPSIGVDGTIYIGAEDHYLYAINHDGKLEWKFLAGSVIATSPAIGADGTIYFNSKDSFLYAINPDGTLKWKFSVDMQSDSSPAIGTDGTIYVGSGDHYLYAINSDGTLKWKYLTNGWISSFPAIGPDGTVYIGSYDTNLYALSPDGSLKWTFDLRTEVHYSPVIFADGTINIGEFMFVWAINPDGTEKWHYYPGCSTTSSPAIDSKGTIYIGLSYISCLGAINPDGTEKWRYQTLDILTTSPVIGADRTIYFGTDDGYLYAIGEKAAPTPTPTPSATTTPAVTGEFQVSSNGRYSDVAMDDTGNFVITWNDWNEGVMALRYDYNGYPLGSEFVVKSSAWGTDIAMDDDGNFILLSESSAYKYNSNGDLIWFKTLDYSGYNANIVMNNSDKFVITYANDDISDFGIFAWICDDKGNPLSSKFQVNTYTSGEQSYPSIAMDNTGNFVITWRSMLQDGSYGGIYAQRFDGDGTPQGSEFQVNTYTDDYQEMPSIAMNEEGNFVITWMSKGQDGSGYGIYARRYDKNGTPLSDEFRVNTYTFGNQIFPSIAMDDIRNFIIVWDGDGQIDSEYGILAKKYDSNGNPLGDEFKVNNSNGGHEFPSISMNNAGNFIISWGDGSINIYARLFQAKTGTPTPTPTPTITSTATPTPVESIRFTLWTLPPNNTFTTGESFDLMIDIKTPAEPIYYADLYFVMMENSTGNIYFSPLWTTKVSPVLKNYKMLAGIHSIGNPLIHVNIPQDKPPIKEAGFYTFAVAAAKPGTLEWVSNIATVGLSVN
jgi:outer membrane protein assembly factor BamB